MKKLSFILALIMALSCFSVTAFAAETSTEESSAATTAAPAEVFVKVIWKNLEGSKLEPKDDVVLKYQVAAGATLTAADIIKAVKASVDEAGNKVIDSEEYVVSETVHAYDASGKYEFKSLKVEAGATYNFDVYAVEINDIEVFASVLSEEAAGIPWGDITAANITLFEQIMNGFMAAIKSIKGNVDAKDEEKTEAAVVENTTAESVETTPDTGASAVAGAAVVVLALSAATAVVLRKKED